MRWLETLVRLDRSVNLPRFKRFAAVMVVVGLCLSACTSPSPPYSGPSGEPRTIVVIGDSIVWFATDELHAEFVDDRRSILGISGATVGAMTLSASDAVALHPTVLVIALGTNNVSLGGWEQADTDEVQAMADLTRNENVVWIIPNLGGELINAAVEAAGLVGTRWDLFSAGQTDWFAADGIHLTGAGQFAFAAFVSDNT